MALLNDTKETVSSLYILYKRKKSYKKKHIKNLSFLNMLHSLLTIFQFLFIHISPKHDHSPTRHQPDKEVKSSKH